MKLDYPERMPCRYTLPKDLNDRLDGTVCRYDGRVVRVYANSTMLDIYNWAGKVQLAKIKPDDPLLDISAVETGYFNYRSSKTSKNFVCYLIRDPVKKYKAALYPQYVRYVSIKGEPCQLFMPEGLFSQGVLDSLEGTFPSFADAMTIPEEDTEVAISQDIALSRDEIGATYIYYRCTPVGWLAPGDQKIHIVDNDLRWVVSRYLARSGLHI